ncbi:hypothetical protein B0T25DRAFT_546113 [Lasiosphaeria hispida]|uniref:CFEM domain-containing protein n=1 Tax=Lasiosphaeria hispida TaxID=260671 RepID=A0AAJ0MBI0_9PEZI|nr:hypothetical protein B0T25DRAFT_546113 [Lasiosphaeria hispida]
MKFLAVSLVALAGMAMADDVCPATTLMPDCGVGCILTAASDLGCTQITDPIADIKCQCSKSSAVQSEAATCILTKCVPTDVKKVMDAASSICAQCASAPPTPTPV